ncbi:MAG: sulfopyruvate decarboxylase [Deltaproteobacteria bacterium]|nr:sulfopyruvate decarboxylase [Deltaproteobacteria bacterium]MBI3078206.1 sulfopyruvate decarboxylase [Deltaproteobacteria bacterium]
MKKAVAELFVKEMKAAGIEFVCGLPDTGLYELFRLVREDPDFTFIPVTNEGEGVGICAGAWLGGKKAIMLMENSGLRVASEALARLGISFGIPALLLMSYRGEPGDGNWWAVNHGVVMEPLLKALRIPYVVLRRPEEVDGAIRRAFRSMEASKYHFALVASGEALW